MLAPIDVRLLVSMVQLPLELSTNDHVTIMRSPMEATSDSTRCAPHARFFQNSTNGKESKSIRTIQNLPQKSTIVPVVPPCINVATSVPAEHFWRPRTSYRRQRAQQHTMEQRRSHQLYVPPGPPYMTHSALNEAPLPEVT